MLRIACHPVRIREFDRRHVPVLKAPLKSLNQAALTGKLSTFVPTPGQLVVTKGVTSESLRHHNYGYWHELRKAIESELYQHHRGWNCQANDQAEKYNITDC